MGLLDNMKARLAPAKEKVSDLAQQHGGKITHGIDKAAHVVDEKTKGKYSGRIHTGTDKARHAMDRLAHKSGDRAADGTPPTGPENPEKETPPPAS
ncbi:antitoxin [Streptomyces sp. NPDC026672]|uniref:antitoxin n=1 Tax=unclassified Streptomyces TaxID=2593676 RepID=UPI0033C631DD